ncbi:uncharacterized protein LOC6592465 [Drosophila persimilis]|uniref:uncharacterized protein LOC6592465 n=1 Tax=Drosophila persimilis TaxID=7234 RepID=UPI000F0792EB|nr:uncharacterized protein LOC6592465 [Drosophila persimilis]
MDKTLEEFIIFTPLTCVEQCNALMEATAAKPKTCYVFVSLFGAYCGLLAYRAYRNYVANTGTSSEPAPGPLDAIPALPAALVSELRDLPTQLMFESINLAENSWCFYSELTTPSMDHLVRTTQTLDDEEANASTSTSVPKLKSVPHHLGDEN